MKQITKNEIYKHYIALDWSKVNFALASIRDSGTKFNVVEHPANLKILKEYLKQLPGKKILTIEETTTAQWLYVELKDYVDKILICEPFQNKLLNSGPKNDKIDAVKLCTLLRNGSLKEVYHTTDELYKLRKLVSVYEDLIDVGVPKSFKVNYKFISISGNLFGPRHRRASTNNKFSCCRW